ncbi:ATP-dependent Clp protease proteolytic subunit [Hyphomicrobiales bacterium]|nr:ATP-dependent Clp protease protease subunit [Hyphomicrobiales bacterium]CAH1669433.1 ATP-dependent Clp protease proteolytic subunit [Hyphomicrobiales bacterium]
MIENSGLARVIFLSAVYILAIAFGAQANTSEMKASDQKALAEAETAKIYFSGAVSQQKINELVAAIDDLNVNHKALKKIYLYINSGGGEVSSGYAGYWAIKSSNIPITTVNIATVISSATMLFCGSSERESLDGAIFVIHPPSTDVRAASYQPDHLVLMEQNLQTARKFFSDIYRECTNFSDNEMSSILHSENTRKSLLPEEAKKRKMINGIADAIVETPIAFYIFD